MTPEWMSQALKGAGQTELGAAISFAFEEDGSGVALMRKVLRCHQPCSNAPIGKLESTIVRMASRRRKNLDVPKSLAYTKGILLLPSPFPLMSRTGSRS